MQGIADLDVHLPGLVHLPGNFRDTAAAITGFGEILLAFKSHTAAYGQGNTVLLNPHMVGRGLVNGKILPAFGIELFHRRKKLLLGKRVIFVRHTDIPENITVTGFRDKFAAGELRVIIIGPYRNNLELTGGTVEIHLEIVVLTLPQSGKVTVLERYTFGLVMCALLIVSFYTSISGILKAEMFPAQVRALGVGLSYAVANAIFGGLAEYVALSLKSIGMETAFFWYVTLMAVVAFLVSLMLHRKGKGMRL